MKASRGTRIGAVGAGCVCALLLVPDDSFAKDYHVDAAAGGDSNPGTQSKPWRTLARVNKHTPAPGDRVLLRRGSSWAETLVPSASGASGKPVTYGAYGAGKLPRITGVPGKSCITWNSARSHLVFRDLHLYRCGQPGGTKQGGINVWSPTVSRDVVIQGCRIEESRTWNIYVSGLRELVIRNNVISKASLEHGIYIDGSLGVDDVLVEHNDIWGNADMCVQFNSNGKNHITRAVLRRNRLHDCKAGGVNNIGASKLLAHHNLIYGTMAGIYNACNGGIKAKCATAGNYHHNTIVVDGKSWTTCFESDTGADFAELKNNICVHLGTSGPLISVVTKGTSDHNLFFGKQRLDWGGKTHNSFAAYRAGSGQDAHGLYADPLFVDRAKLDFHLTAASPAVDRGAALGYATDLDGKPSPAGAGPDVGAFERQPAGPAHDAAAGADLAGADGATGADGGGVRDRGQRADTDATAGDSGCAVAPGSSSGPGQPLVALPALALLLAYRRRNRSDKMGEFNL